MEQVPRENDPLMERVGHLLAALALAQEGLVVTDQQARVLGVNAAAERLLGSPASVLVGRKMAEVHPGTRLPEVIAGGKPLRCRQRIGGGPVLVSHIPVVEQGQVREVISLYQQVAMPEDLAEEIAAARVLGEICEAILEDVAVGLVLVDTQGRVVLVNPAGLELLGVQPGAACGRYVWEVVPRSQMEKVLRTGQPQQGVELQLGEVDCLLVEAPLKNNGVLVGGIGKVLTRGDKNLKELMDRFQLLEGRLLLYKDEVKQLLSQQPPFAGIVGENPEMQRLKRAAARVAQGDATVLITGESGTGKELMAQAIHNASPRRGETFIKINCAAIPENLLEAELFGYEDGAFTGAAKGGKPGKFELAHRGTIFLDEIGDMPLSMQAKVLRVLQERTFERVGGNKSIVVDVRIIAATNKDLLQLIQEEKFRLDLYYRLSVITMEIPPLRQRREDIVPVTRSIIRRLNEKYGGRVTGLTPGVEEAFLAHQWPGNVRELENVLEYAFNFLDAGDTLIDRHHLPAGFGHGFSRSPGQHLEDQVAEREREAIIKALAASGGNKLEAAQRLGIHRSVLYRKMGKHGIR